MSWAAGAAAADVSVQLAVPAPRNSLQIFERVSEHRLPAGRVAILSIQTYRGAGSCFLPLSVTSLAGVPRDDAGAASGMLQTMQQTGAAIGVAALASVAQFHGRAEALLAAAGIAAVAFVIAYATVRPDRAVRPATSEEQAQEMIPLLLSE